MITRRATFTFLAALSAMPMTAALAGERTRFDRAAFEAALKSGQPLLVDISATWCTTCQQQKAVLSELMKRSDFAKITIFNVDYDTEKDVMRSLGARERSTLIVFKAGAEAGRIVGDTRPAAIEGLLKKAI